MGILSALGPRAREPVSLDHQDNHPAMNRAG
jgi:hypothetical protein